MSKGRRGRGDRSEDDGSRPIIYYLPMGELAGNGRLLVFEHYSAPRCMFAQASLLVITYFYD
jgi:hypothetical protein